MPDYQELRVRFERDDDADGSYHVYVSGPSGEASGSFTPPFSQLELENLVLKLGRPRGVRRVDSPDMELIRTFGGALFDSVFNGRVRDVYVSSLASVRSAGQGMRISLALRAGTCTWCNVTAVPGTSATTRWPRHSRAISSSVPRAAPFAASTASSCSQFGQLKMTSIGPAWGAGVAAMYPQPTTGGQPKRRGYSYVRDISPMTLNGNMKALGRT